MNSTEATPELEFSFELPEAPSAHDEPSPSTSAGMLEDGPYGLPDPHGAPALAHIDAADKPAEERIAALFGQMATQRTVLLAILRRCLAVTPSAELYAAIEALQADHASVFSPQNLCALLAEAGALERVDADGAPLADEPADPQVTVRDGVEVVEPAPRREAYWKTTEAGSETVDADDAAARLRQLSEDDGRYLPIYQKLLELCSAPGGAPTASISAQIDKHPLLQEPRFYATKFLDKLERAGGIEWKGAWTITAEGAELARILGEEAHADCTDASKMAERPEGIRP